MAQGAVKDLSRKGAGQFACLASGLFRNAARDFLGGGKGYLHVLELLVRLFDQLAEIL